MNFLFSVIAAAGLYIIYKYITTPTYNPSTLDIIANNVFDEKQYIKDQVSKHLSNINQEELKLIDTSIPPSLPHIEFTIGSTKRYVTKKILRKHRSWCVILLLEDLDIQLNLDSNKNTTIELPSNIFLANDIDNQIGYLGLENYWKLPMDTLDYLSTRGIINSLAYASFSPVLAPNMSLEDVVMASRIAEFELGSSYFIGLGSDLYNKAWKYLKDNVNIVPYQVIVYETHTIIVLLQGIPVYLNIMTESPLACGAPYLAIERWLDTKEVHITINTDNLQPLGDLYKSLESIGHCKKYNVRKKSSLYYPWKLCERSELFESIQSLELVIP